MIQILHNPRCSKSRECLAMLESENVDHQIVKYLNDTPSVDELREIVRKMDVKPIEVVRVKEPLWREQFAGRAFSDEELLKVLSENPILIERPIVINGDKAVIARPASKAFAII